MSTVEIDRDELGTLSAPVQAVEVWQKGCPTFDHAEKHPCVSWLVRTPDGWCYQMNTYRGRCRSNNTPNKYPWRGVKSGYAKVERDQWIPRWVVWAPEVPMVESK